MRGENFSLDPTISKTTGNKDAIDIADHCLCAVILDRLRLHTDDLDFRVVMCTGVDEGFVDRLVSVLQLDVFSSNGDGDLVLGMDHPLNEGFPFLKVGGRRVAEADFIDDKAVDLIAAKVEWALVNRVGDIAKGDDVLFLHVAEHGDLLAVVLVEIGLGAADDDVRLDPEFAKFCNGLLSRLGLCLAGSLDVGQQGDVDEADVVLANLQRKLAQRFDEKQPFHIADRAANFRDENIYIGVVRSDLVHSFLNLVGNVGNELHGLAEVFAAPLLFNHGIEDLAGGEVVHLRHDAGGETLVVAEVEIGLRTIVEHIDLAVLVRRHRAGIDVQVRVEFLHQGFESASFKERADGGRSEAFTE